MGDFGAARDKWVCPNDRELSLRAKLKTGWSVKTNSMNSFAKPAALDDSEQEAIVNVIKRAENLDKVEQERIGRLVEKLDNMKKNAMGNGMTQCVLCADEFGILGASPLSCNDCKKAVCTKCGVDTVSSHKQPLWLCKICAETRETWKKSGAWFYKGLPKYILPGRKTEAAKYTSPGKTMEPPSYNAWLQNKGRSGSEYTDSSDDDIKATRLTKKPTLRHSHQETVENSESLYAGNVATPESPPYKASESSFWPRKEEERPSEESSLEFCLLYEPRDEALHCTIYRAKGLKATDCDGLADPYLQLCLLPRQSKSDELRTRTVHKTLNPEYEETVSFYGVTEYDLAKRTLRLRVVDEDAHAPRPMGEIHLSLKKMGGNQPSYANLYLESPSPAEELCRGRILLALAFSGDALTVGVVRCEGLPPRSSTAPPDPFVKVQVKADAMRRRCKTATKKKTCCPEYNEEFTFETKAGDLRKQSLEVSVWDKEYGKQEDYVGGLAFNVHSKGERLHHWLDILRNPNQRFLKWHSLSNSLFMD